MKVTGKEFAPVKKNQVKLMGNGSRLMSTTSGSSKVPISRSLTRTKIQSSSGLHHSPTKKKPKQLQIIREKPHDTPKKKVKDKTNNDKALDKNTEKHTDKPTQKPNDKTTANNQNGKKKKATNYCLNLKQLKPVNLEKQKELFFQNNGQYDPFFIYPNISDLNDDEYKDSRKYETADESYLELAISILEKAKEIGITKMLADSELLTKEQTASAFDQYIARLGISDLLTYEFVENTIAPTSVVHNNQDCMSRVLISVPILYRKKTIEGVLNHEIGTHFLRKYNDRTQKWFKDRKKYSLGPYLQTQEGLAALNQLTSYVMQDSLPPLLYRPAMMYYLCYLASKLPFSKLYQEAAKYQPDPEYRWRECVRVKRGIADTSKAAGMYKDQIYFMGALEILKRRKQINFYQLWGGKICVEDCLRLQSKGSINEQKTKYPHFIGNMKAYMRCLDFIAEINDIK